MNREQDFIHLEWSEEQQMWHYNFVESNLPKDDNGFATISGLIDVESASKFCDYVDKHKLYLDTDNPQKATLKQIIEYFEEYQSSI